MNCPRCNLEPDYIPKRPKDGVDSVVGEIREMGSDEFAQCGVTTGNDIQSGPIYCGRQATHTAPDLAHDGYRFAVCSKHLRLLKGRYQEQQRKKQEEARNNWMDEVTENW